MKNYKFMVALKNKDLSIDDLCGHSDVSAMAFIANKITILFTDGSRLCVTQ